MARLRRCIGELLGMVVGGSSLSRKLSSDPIPSGYVELALTETDPLHIRLTPPIPMVLYVCYMYHYLALQSPRNRFLDRLGGFRH